MPTHDLKTWPDQYAALADGRKTFEWRPDDRRPPFAVDDIIKLHEFVPHAECGGSGRVPDHTDYVDCGCPKPHGAYTGKILQARVTYILRREPGRPAFGIPDGFAVLALASVRPWVDQLGADRQAGGAP